MQIGDILICKRKTEVFSKGGEYYVTQVDKMYNSNIIRYKISNYYMRPNGVNIVPNNGCSAYFYDDTYYKFFDDSYIWDHFYTKKEMRKKKLKKLNASWR